MTAMIEGNWVLLSHAEQALDVLDVYQHSIVYYQTVAICII